MVPPYGSDITDPIPYTLSNPAGAINYATTGEAYDAAIAGLPLAFSAPVVTWLVSTS